MKEIRVALEEFRLSEFISVLMDFSRELGSGDINPTQYTYWVKSVGETPQEWPEDFIPDLKDELLTNGKSVFFTFSDTNVGEPLQCADGNSYLLDEEEDGFNFGEGDVMGFLIRYDQGDLIINSAVHSFAWPPPPVLEIIEDCSVFEVPMTKFIKRFIKN